MRLQSIHYRPFYSFLIILLCWLSQTAPSRAAAPTSEPAVEAEDDRLFVEAVQRAGNVSLAADVSETADQRYAVVPWAEPFEQPLGLVDLERRHLRA